MKCKPLANCVCTVPLIDGLFRLLVCGLHASSSRSLTRASYSSILHPGVDTRHLLWLLVPSRYTEQVDPLKVSLFLLAYWLFARVHDVTSERSSFRENPTYCRPVSDAEYVVSYVERLIAREVRCKVTDRSTYTKTTVILALHAWWGLNIASYSVCMGIA